MKEKITASKLMITNVPVIDGGMTVGDCRKMLDKEMKSLKTAHYIYVTDVRGRLKGVVSINDILRHSNTVKVARIMIRDVKVVHPHTHQERIAYIALLNSITAVPVVDKDGVFMGAVLSRSILSVMHKELSEDLMRFAGLRHTKSFTDNVLTQPLLSSFRHRLPWLLIGLAGGILSAGIIQFFESTLEKNLILAAFIPLIVYMNDAVGTQMEAFVIRDTALEPKLPFIKYFFRQLIVVLLIGLVSSAGLFVFASILYQFKVATVLAVALLIGILSSVLTGLLVPFSFSRMKMDPANASGPIATIIQDLLSVAIYFLIASAVL